MRIALDARFLTNPQEGGFKTYTTNLVRALASVDRQNEYVLYVDRDTDEWFGPNLRPVPVRGRGGPARMPWREQLSLRRRIDADRPDLVHFLCNTATLGLAVPYVVTLHDVIQLSSAARARPSARSVKSWTLAAYSRRTIVAGAPRAARIIAPSSHVRADIAATLHVPPERISVVQEAAAPVFRPVGGDDLRARRDALAARVELPARYVFAVGYERRKNIELLIDACARLGPEHADVWLVVLSSDPTGERRAAFTARARARGFDRFRVLGSVAVEDAVTLYAGAEIVAAPSESEGFGLPALEAMACGVPAVVMNASSLPEVVGEGGIVVDSREPAAWAAILGELLSDQRRRSAIGAMGRARAATFSWERCARETVAVYESAMAASAGRRN